MNGTLKNVAAAMHDELFGVGDVGPAEEWIRRIIVLLPVGPRSGFAILRDPIDPSAGWLDVASGDREPLTWRMVRQLHGPLLQLAHDRGIRKLAANSRYARILERLGWEHQGEGLYVIGIRG